MNGTDDHRHTAAGGRGRSTKHGSQDVALIAYLFMAAFAYVFAAISGTV